MGLQIGVAKLVRDNFTFNKLNYPQLYANVSRIKVRPQFSCILKKMGTDSLTIWWYKIFTYQGSTLSVSEYWPAGPVKMTSWWPEILSGNHITKAKIKGVCLSIKKNAMQLCTTSGY